MSTVLPLLILIAAVVALLAALAVSIELDEEDDE